MTKVRWTGAAFAACALVATGAMTPASASAHAPVTTSSSLPTGVSAADGGLDYDHGTARPFRLDVP